MMKQHITALVLICMSVSGCVARRPHVIEPEWAIVHTEGEVEWRVSSAHKWHSRPTRSLGVGSEVRTKIGKAVALNTIHGTVLEVENRTRISLGASRDPATGMADSNGATWNFPTYTAVSSVKLLKGEIVVSPATNRSCEISGPFGKARAVVLGGQTSRVTLTETNSILVSRKGKVRGKGVWQVLDKEGGWQKAPPQQ